MTAVTQTPTASAVPKADSSGKISTGWLDQAALKALMSLATTTTDNAVIRADSTAGGTQNSGVIIDDSNNVSGIATLANSGVHTNSNATDATTATAAAHKVAGGMAIVKNVISGAGKGKGVAIVATTNGTVTLTIASAEIQTFTGTTAGTIIAFPAANCMGAGVACCYTINNQSNQTITPTRAGADTFQGGGTTDAIAAGKTVMYASDGVSVWLKIGVVA